MDFNWKSPVVPRVAILAASIFAFGFLLFSVESYIVAFIFLLVTIFQIKQLVELVDHSNKDLASFFDSIKFDEL